MRSAITGTTQVVLAIGDPVSKSLSPAMHNAGYRSLDLAARYVYVPARVEGENLAAALAGMKALNFRGASVLMPHKERILELLDLVDETAKRIGSVNTVVNSEGKLKGFNTDWLGVVGALERHGSLRGKRVALLGAGGTGRAACFGLNERGAEVTIFNRTLERAEALAAEFGGKAGQLDDQLQLQEFDIVLNTTSLGMSKKVGEGRVGDIARSPVGPGAFRVGQLVCDVVYTPLKTQFLADAEAAGAEIIFGTEVLLQQGVAQFELFTGQTAPVTEMREALQAAVSGSASLSGS